MRPSVLLKRLFLLVHILALSGCLFNGLPVNVKWVLSTLVAISWLDNVRHMKTEHRTLKFASNGNLEIAWQNGDFKPVKPLGSTVITPWLIFLHLQDRPPVLIAKDAVANADDFRRFAVKLKMHGSTL